MERMEMPSYVNEPQRPRPIHRSHPTERNWSQTVLLSFGLLCIIQATLNVTLRLTSKSGCSTVLETQTSPPAPGEQDVVVKETKQCNELRKRVKDFEEEVNRLGNKNIELNGQLTELNNQVNDLKNENNQFRSQNGELSNQINRLNDKITDLENQNRELNNKINRANDQMNDLDNRNRLLSNQVNDLNNKNSQLTNQNGALNNQISELNNKNNDLRNQIKSLNLQIGVLSDKNTELISQKETVTAKTVCPDRWWEMRGRCYFLSSQSEQRSWYSSRSYCQSLGADLVVINDEQEQRDLYQLKGDRELLFWIGLHDDTNSGTFKWVDNTPLTAVFWQAGQPGDGGPNNVESCVEFYHKNPVLSSWNDARCADSRRWVCEKERRQN